jgi:hypothetical protein
MIPVWTLPAGMISGMHTDRPRFAHSEAEVEVPFSMICPTSWPSLSHHNRKGEGEPPKRSPLCFFTWLPLWPPIRWCPRIGASLLMIEPREQK